MKRFRDWLHDRTGYQEILHEALYERIPGGSRWRYVWGSTLVFVFVVQMISGVFLWSAYSPSAQTAWESVYYIQHEMYMGNIVRGIHHYAAQLMVVLLAIHLIQVIIDGAYKAPREINFWLGLILMQIVLGLSLTGYLLPWDQKGYYATQVSTKIVGATPMIGPQLQELAQGGKEYGHHTLTRFFAMHAGVLPGALIAFLALHIYVFRRHGITVADPDKAPETTFWPDQVLKDGVACLGVLAVILLCTVFKGAELSAPANPSEAYSAARPEWYFLFLFRFLRFEFIEHFGLAFGAIYVPGVIMLVLALMPMIAMVRGGHRFNVIFMWLISLCIIGLTAASMIEDYLDADHQSAIAEADRDAERVMELAALPDKIPVEGAGALLRDDPFTQGPRIFAKHCASCHRYDGHNGRGIMLTELKEIDGQQVEQMIVPSATDLHGFGGRDWWRAVLLDFAEHFGPTVHHGYDLESSEMVEWSSSSRDLLTAAANKKDLQSLIEYLVAQSGRTDLELDAELIARGKELIDGGEFASGEAFYSSCTDCHASIGEEFVAGAENGGYPELNGYAGQEWLTEFIKDPGSDQFYGDKNLMPAYAEKMSARERDLLVRWMIGDFEPTHISDYPSKKTELQDALNKQTEKSDESEDQNDDDTSEADSAAG